ncbi:hypothetical protein F1559_005160 [Cyanidiococcus yangmingshanensis]|uniref:Uncharacterized protein n=1 Tax=Cyanidiococcus yangmingshanensis TaxID=2690220 RepID=A0A7J7IR11_9RHOD|nr:hypothetical protein F1559_005160 [Cyanidiococcus yangmingshanensis]
MLIRRWIMGGMTEPTLERHPYEDQQDVECERHGRDLLRSLVNGERTVASERDVDVIREMLAIWRRRLHYRNALLESKHTTDEDGTLQQKEDLEPNGSHLDLAGRRTRQERIICTCCNGRVTMTDSCGA